MEKKKNWLDTYLTPAKELVGYADIITIHSEYFKNYFAFFHEVRKANAQTKKNYLSLYKSFRKDAEVIFDLTTWCKRNKYDDEVEKMLSDN